MSHIEEYWTVDQAAEYYGISTNSLTKWRNEAFGRWDDMAEPDYRIGGANLWHKDKWRELLAIHYADTIESLSKLGLVFTADAVERVTAQSYDQGFALGLDEGYERGREAGPRHNAMERALKDHIEPLEETADVNEPLVAYATTKGPDFGKLTDGHGFQPIV